MRQPDPRRIAAERTGKRAEGLAALVMMTKGFAILERRFRTPVGEIDLIARRGRLLVFTEVKARATIEKGLVSVPYRSRRRIERAGENFLSRRRTLENCFIRYDLIIIAPWRWRHVPAAWRYGE